MISGIAVQEFPAEMQQWKLRVEWLTSDFCTFSKQVANELKELLAFCNGNTALPILQHFCLPGCCTSDADSLNKCIRLVVPWFSKGYSVPLLYRFKHYGPASSFIKIGFCFHQILPRVLGAMASSSPNPASDAPHVSEMIEALLADQGPVENEPDNERSGNLTEREMQTLLSDLLDGDANFAMRNSARRLLVSKEMQKHGFDQSAVLMDIILQPMEHAVNFFLKRTALLSKINLLGEDHPEYAKWLENSQASFQRVLSGKLGMELMSDYKSLLNASLLQAMEMGLDPTPDKLTFLFRSVVVCVSDIWRRMVYEFECLPYSCFQWLSLDLNNFVCKWDSLQEKSQKCYTCLDCEFTAEIVAQFPFKLHSKPRHEQERVFLEVKNILSAIAAVCPLSSDSVEIKNGNVQWCVSRRGNQFIKGQVAAIESTLLQSAIKRHSWLQDWAAAETLPSRRVQAGILRQTGVKSSNQYTSRNVASQADSSLSSTVQGPDLLMFESLEYGLAMARTSLPSVESVV